MCSHSIGIDVALHGERAYPASAYEDGWPEHLDFHEVHEAPKQQHPDQRHRPPSLLSHHPLFENPKAEECTRREATASGTGEGSVGPSPGPGLVTVSGLVREHEIILARTVPVLLSRIASLKRVPSAPGELVNADQFGNGKRRQKRRTEGTEGDSARSRASASIKGSSTSARQHHDSYSYSFPSSSSSSGQTSSTSTTSGSNTLRKQLGLSLSEYARAVFNSRVEKTDKTPSLAECGPDPDTITHL